MIYRLSITSQKAKGRQSILNRPSGWGGMPTWKILLPLSLALSTCVRRIRAPILPIMEPESCELAFLLRTKSTAPDPEVVMPPQVTDYNPKVSV